MIRKQNLRIIKFFIILFTILLFSTVQAADKVVVIPLFGHGKPLKNIVTVAKGGGMFTDPVAAVNSITDASENNPYLVAIAPGIYTLIQPLVMKQWVDIAGSGENVTRLTGTISSEIEKEDSTIVQGASDTMISDLTVENTGGGTFSIGIYNNNISRMKISRVTVNTSGAANNFSIETYKSSLIISNVTAFASDGAQNTGIINNTSAVTLIHAVATARGNSSSYNNGILNDHCSPEMIDVTATALYGLGNCGIRNDGASPTMEHVHAEGFGGANNYGVFNQSSYCYPQIRRSTIIGDTYAVMSLDGPGVTILTQSTLLMGGVYTYGNAIIKCIACDNSSIELGEYCE